MGSILFHFFWATLYSNRIGRWNVRPLYCIFQWLELLGPASKKALHGLKGIHRRAWKMSSWGNICLTRGRLVPSILGRGSMTNAHYCKIKLSSTDQNSKAVTMNVEIIFFEVSAGFRIDMFSIIARTSCLSAGWHWSKKCKFWQNSIHFTIKPDYNCTLLPLESWFQQFNGGFYPSDGCSRPPPTSVAITLDMLLTFADVFTISICLPCYDCPVPCKKTFQQYHNNRRSMIAIWNFFLQTETIGDFRNVFKFHAYSVNKRLFLTTTKLVRGLSDVATTNVCKVDTSNRNHIERSRWMKWLITGLRQNNIH